MLYERFVVRCVGKFVSCGCAAARAAKAQLQTSKVKPHYNKGGMSRSRMGYLLEMILARHERQPDLPGLAKKHRTTIHPVMQAFSNRNEPMGSELEQKSQILSEHGNP
eukprot:2236689-Amphidinium_carterae.1